MSDYCIIAPFWTWMDGFYTEIIFAVIERNDDCGCSLKVRLFIYISAPACYACACAPNLTRKFIKMGFRSHRLQGNHLTLPNRKGNLMYWENSKIIYAEEWGVNWTRKSFNFHLAGLMIGLLLSHFNKITCRW